MDCIRTCFPSTDDSVPENIKKFRALLEENHDLLVSYVFEQVPLEELDEWLRKKRQAPSNTSQPCQESSTQAKPSRNSPRKTERGDSSLEVKTSNRFLRPDTASSARNGTSCNTSFKSSASSRKENTSSTSNTFLGRSAASSLKVNGSSFTSTIEKYWSSSPRHEISSNTSLEKSSGYSTKPNTTNFTYTSSEKSSISPRRPQDTKFNNTSSESSAVFQSHNGSSNSFEKITAKTHLGLNANSDHIIIYSVKCSRKFNGINSNASTLDKIYNGSQRLNKPQPTSIYLQPAWARKYNRTRSSQIHTSWKKSRVSPPVNGTPDPVVTSPCLKPSVVVSHSSASASFEKASASSRQNGTSSPTSLNKSLSGSGYEFELCTKYKWRGRQLPLMSPASEEDVPDTVTIANGVHNVPAKQETMVHLNGGVLCVPPKLELPTSSNSVSDCVTDSSPESPISSGGPMKWPTWSAKNATRASAGAAVVTEPPLHRKPNSSEVSSTPSVHRLPASSVVVNVRQPLRRNPASSVVLSIHRPTRRNPASPRAQVEPTIHHKPASSLEVKVSPERRNPVNTIVTIEPPPHREPTSPRVETVGLHGPRTNLSETPKTENAGRKPRLLPKESEVVKLRRACSSSCVHHRQLHLIKPTMPRQFDKDITTRIETIVIELFQESLIETYLIDLRNSFFSVVNGSLEYSNSYHEIIVRKVVADDRAWFLSRHDLNRILHPPKHMVTYFNRNRCVAFVPLKANFGDIVIEIWAKSPFDHTRRALVHSLQKILSVSLPIHRQYQYLLQDTQLSNFLLHVAQAVFEEMISLDQLIKKILEVAQHLVNADRASLFLVDHTNSELVSTVFDLRYEANQDSEFFKEEIRIPINKGIAGHVAMSGETLNIPDAYLDDRFNKTVDEATGYHTVSILCMPIKVRGKVLAVVQMVNKRDKNIFGPNDESAFQVFSTFFGLALHHAKLYDKIKRKEQKYKVALEVLGYHNTCCEEDVVKVLEAKAKDANIDYNDFTLNPFEVSDIQKCNGILTMFEDLFGMTRFDLTVLTRFVLTVKKNYRRVPYHNFDHGWAVANSMYVMLKTDTENRFDFNNRLSLFVASLCHDLDHRGYTNKFMSEIDSPLAAIYTTSTLEHHHFNMTVTILQQEGHNIFYQMSSEEYKAILDSIRQCILATDLATFFPNLKKINELVFETPQFDWDDVNHSMLAANLSMTGADLSASAKPFDTQLRTVEIIFAEFYQQGDLELRAGRSPVPMMDRRCQDQLPACQVGFLSSICQPCYRVLAELFPQTKPMLNMVNANIEEWKERAEKTKKKEEE